MAILVEYNKDWSKLYKQHVKLIKRKLGIKHSNTFHIGATAIKDMPARPVIDILVVLYDEKAVQGLLEIGYKPAPDGSYILHTDKIDYSVRLAIIGYTMRLEKHKQLEMIEPYLAIPFYLSENKEAAAEFAQKKRTLAAQFEHDPDAYQEAKKQLLDEILPVAMNYKNQRDKSLSYIAIGMCLGCSIGMCFGVAMNNIGVGMCIGISVGMCLGLALGAAQTKKDGDKHE